MSWFKWSPTMNPWSDWLRFKFSRRNVLRAHFCSDRAAQNGNSFLRKVSLPLRWSGFLGEQSAAAATPPQLTWLSKTEEHGPCRQPPRTSGRAPDLCVVGLCGRTDKAIDLQRRITPPPKSMKGDEWQAIWEAFDLEAKFSHGEITKAEACQILFRITFFLNHQTEPKMAHNAIAVGCVSDRVSDNTLETNVA